MNKIVTKNNHSVSLEKSVSSYTFFLYIIFVISFFLHMSTRIAGLSVIRPDLVLATLIAIMLLFESDKLTGRFNSSSNRILMILFAYIFLSLPLVEWPGSVIRDNLFDFMKVIVFFYFTILIIDTEYRLKCFVLVFIVCQLFRIMEPLYLHVLFGYWGSTTYLGDEGVAYRLSGAPSDVINPNGLAFVIATVLPFIHYLWWTSEIRVKIICLSIIPLMLYALVLTLSRSGLIAVMVVVWIVFLKSNHKLVVLLLVLVASTVIWVNMTDIQKDRYLSLTGSSKYLSSATVQGRIGGIGEDFKVALNRPVVGHGLGTSREAIVHDMGGKQLAHDIYAEAMIELGIIGLIIYLMFIKTIYDTVIDTNKKILMYIRANKSSTGENTEGGKDKFNYETNLAMALNATFWMFIVFSIAQYGVSEYHWYLIAGLSVALNRRITNEIERMNESVDFEIQ